MTRVRAECKKCFFHSAVISDKCLVVCKYNRLLKVHEALVSARGTFCTDFGSTLSRCSTVAPKGRHTLAQGNALGRRWPIKKSPEGAIQMVIINVMVPENQP